MKPFNLFPYDSNVDFMRLRYVSIAIAALIMFVAIGAMATKGFNFALDFTGGTVTELKFAKPATLSLSYSNCSPLLLLKRVVYTNELLGILELLPSIDDLRTRTVSASIRHFSRYAVAW